MPRTARASVGDLCYRGNDRCQVFFEDGVYQVFLEALAHACVEVPLRLVAWCLMPKHFHLVLWPHADGVLSRWMHRLLDTHVRRYHRHHRSSGHLSQGRLEAFAIAQDDHLLTVPRYAERNALRGALVALAEDWAWSSVRCAAGLDARPAEWVNAAVSATELEALRRNVERGRPYGESGWQRAVAARLGWRRRCARAAGPGSRQCSRNKPECPLSSPAGIETIAVFNLFIP